MKRTNVNVDNIRELLIFLLWTPYRFGGDIYQQTFGAAMDSQCPRCCEHVDGGLGAEDHRHSTTYSRSRARVASFSREGKMKKSSIPFLDAKFTRKEDGSVKSTMYGKKMHINQCLKFASQPTQMSSEARSCQNAYEQV